MQQDKYTAVWVSHSSITDYLNCPRAYFLNNVYKDPQSGHKINIMSPPLALGQAVHEVIESLSVIPVDKRFDKPLLEKFESSWKKISGKKGGFFDKDLEEKYKFRGREMLKNIKDNPGPLNNLAVKINMDLPYFWLSQEANIILCGKIDWIEYLPDENSVHIIDFKTGKKDESSDSLQLPIYLLLASNCQNRKVSKVSYWYLDRNKKPVAQPLPEIEKAKYEILIIAKKIKLARQLNKFECPQKDGCHACKPLEAVINGEAEFVGVDSYKQDIYVLKPKSTSENHSIIL